MSNKKILYHCPPARSIRNAWLIHELREQGLAKDIEIKKIDFQKGEHKQPEFKKLNPHGKLPVYVDGDKVILESGAILIHLAQKYKKFIPKDTAKFYMWIIYAVATVDANLDALFEEKKNPNKEIKAIREAALKENLQYIQDQLGDREYIVGNSFSAADIAIEYCLQYAEYLGPYLKEFPKLQKYNENLAKRSARMKAVDEKNVELKAEASRDVKKKGVKRKRVTF